jgi:anaerobic ribonucleoside-triphosphate reductase activating protein
LTPRRGSFILVDIVDTVSVAHLCECTEAEGPGPRFAVWLQGCPLGCEGCCNPEMQASEGGERVPALELAGRLHEAAARHALEGLTLSGGEPFEQARGAAVLAGAARTAGLGVWVFSGYTRRELEERALLDDGVAALLGACDVVVDGRYDHRAPERRRRWIGSRNQIVHALSGRYRLDDPRFERPNSLEIRISGGALEVNGWPGALELVRGRGRGDREGPR